ncbi:MAG: hypothetical protein A2Y10_12105 [Planctomycetes bacterium GWF2_41_51]|nr:MAG: hypothetical protein A2Y10_12105 [Planctomycetes bacterium GWF2_41_51]HBG28689.1 hypothetical protein [Phycisphaerales bacterium]
MALDYSSDFCKNLYLRFEQLELHRPVSMAHYEPQTELTYDFQPINGGEKIKIKLAIERFVGGGFAGQVYKIKILDTDKPQLCRDLQVGNIYAMKILVPPSNFSRLFRNSLYWLGFGGPFQLQVNPAAAKAGALWQKFIRRAAQIKFGDEKSVVNIFGTLVDSQIGSCGEISEWIEGRTWRLEVDDHIDLLKKWRKGQEVDSDKLGSPEYRTKYVFMHEFVNLLHEIGAHEFARQYEWTTLKSQPNCLKRIETGTDAEKGLVAVDFRAGLALLPFLPMSPGDFKLIGQGIKRGSLVQFDRGDLNQLKTYIDTHKENFSDMTGMYDQLVAAEDIYRNSVPDVSHNHIRLFTSGKLWSTIFDSAVVGWKVQNIIDDTGFEKLRNSRFKTFIFFLIGLIPILGRVLRKFWCHNSWRKHYISLLTSFGYFKKAMQGKVLEMLAKWHRAGRISQEKGEMLANHKWRILYHLPLLILILPFLHRFLTDWQFVKEKFHDLVIRPIKLYFDSGQRKQWLLDMIQQGKDKHILTDEDAEIIESQLDEPFIQKYLVSLVVHLMTIFVSEITWLLVTGIYLLTHPDVPAAERAKMVGAILLAFHVLPISPGSLVRGFYTVSLAIRERNFKDYNIALFLSFFKIVGYLAFPIQMTYRYPALARFMAAHWATDAVHIVPVFGERGALFEHAIFCIFYNWPLTIRRRIRARAELREKLEPHNWHIFPISIIAACVLAFFVKWHFNIAAAMLCFGAGAFTTIFCGKASLLKRISLSAAAGFLTALIYTFISILMNGKTANDVIISGLWHCFGFTIAAVVGAIVTELSLPDVENAPK